MFLHGGPGGGIAPDHRRLFDPGVYDVVLFDQRGCGRSPRMPASRRTRPGTLSLISNDCGRSWARTNGWYSAALGFHLALAYAEKHPERVSELVLRGVYTVTKAELSWYYQFGASEIFPDKWEKFQAPIPQVERDNMIVAYRKRLTSDDSVVQLEAAKAWSTWEGETITLLPNPAVSSTHGASILLSPLPGWKTTTLFTIAGWKTVSFFAMRFGFRVSPAPSFMGAMTCRAPRICLSAAQSLAGGRVPSGRGGRARLFRTGYSRSTDQGDGSLC